MSNKFSSKKRSNIEWQAGPPVNICTTLYFLASWSIFIGCAFSGWSESVNICLFLVISSTVVLVAVHSHDKKLWAAAYREFRAEENIACWLREYHGNVMWWRSRGFNRDDEAYKSHKNNLEADGFILDPVYENNIPSLIQYGIIGEDGLTPGLLEKYDIKDLDKNVCITDIVTFYNWKVGAGGEEAAYEACDKGLRAFGVTLDPKYKNNKELLIRYGILKEPDTEPGAAPV